MVSKRKSSWKSSRQPGLYVVKTEIGSTIRRNRRDLLTTPEKFELREIPDYEGELPTSLQLSQDRIKKLNW